MKWTLPDESDVHQWPRKILLVAPQEDQLDIIFDKVASYADEFGIPLTVDRRSGSKQLMTKWGSVFRGMTGGNPRAGRGYAWQYVFADEAPQVEQPRKLFHEVLFPTLADSRGKFVAIGTPDAVGTMAHSWKMLGENPDNDEWGFMTGPSVENWHMPWLVDEIEAMRKAGVPEDIIQREWFAKFVPRTGVVYPTAHQCILIEKDWSRLEDSLKRNGKWCRFIDFGFTNPFACIVACVMGETLYLWDEYYRTNRVLDEHAVVLHQMDKKYQFDVNIADQAEPGSIRTLAAWRSSNGNRLSGSWVLSMDKPPIIDSIDLVRERMGMGLVKIHPRCQHLIKEYGAERYPEAREMMNFAEKPIDANNHGTSGVRYGAWFFFKNSRMSDPDKQQAAAYGESDANAALEGYVV